MKRIAVVVTTLVTAGFMTLASVALAATNNSIGTWKLNVAKSTWSPGPAAKSQIAKVEAWGEDGVTYTSDLVGADGKPTHMEFQAKFDGKEVPFVGNPDADTISLKLIDANTIESVSKLKGKVTLTVRGVVSSDGKTRTLTQTGKNAQGAEVKNVLLFERQ
jgi:hypothetical protein